MPCYNGIKGGIIPIFESDLASVVVFREHKEPWKLEVLKEQTNTKGEMRGRGGRRFLLFAFCCPALPSLPLPFFSPRTPRFPTLLAFMKRKWDGEGRGVEDSFCFLFVALPSLPLPFFLSLHTKLSNASCACGKEMRWGVQKIPFVSFLVPYPPSPFHFSHASRACGKKMTAIKVMSDLG